MILTLAVMATLARACAPAVAPETLLSVARVESGFNPLAVGLEGGRHLRRGPETLDQAITVTRRLVARGESVDLGLAQINSRNLKALHLTLRQAFDPCRNLEAGAAVLSGAYRSAPLGLRPQSALRRALSLYNTGSPTRGFANGYVARVEAMARALAPGIGKAPPDRSPVLLAAAADPWTAPRQVSPGPPAAAWDVFAGTRRGPGPQAPATGPPGSPTRPDLLVFASEG